MDEFIFIKFRNKSNKFSSPSQLFIKYYIQNQEMHFGSVVRATCMATTLQFVGSSVQLIVAAESKREWVIHDQDRSLAKHLGNKFH